MCVGGVLTFLSPTISFYSSKASIETHLYLLLSLLPTQETSYLFLPLSSAFPLPNGLSNEQLWNRSIELAKYKHSYMVGNLQGLVRAPYFSLHYLPTEFPILSSSLISSAFPVSFSPGQGNKGSNEVMIHILLSYNKAIQKVLLTLNSHCFQGFFILT